MRRQLLLSLVVWLPLLTSAAAGETWQWQFTPKGWNPAEWTLAKSPYDNHFGQWVQHDDYLTNAVPADATPQEWQGKRAAECYTSMVWSKPLSGDAKIRTTLWFTPHMAPLIVLSSDLGHDAQGRPEYREYFEICVFDQGVNVWHHAFVDGHPKYKLAAHVRFALLPETKYALDVELKGQQLTVKIDGHEFGYLETGLPAKYYVGVTGCEGLNRFYDFSVTGKLAAP